MLTQSLKNCCSNPPRFFPSARQYGSDARRQFQSGKIDEKRYKQMVRESNATPVKDESKWKSYSQEILREIKEIAPEFEKPGADEVELTKHYMRKTGELRQTQAKEKIEEKGFQDRFRKVERI